MAAPFVFPRTARRTTLSFLACAAVLMLSGLVSSAEVTVLVIVGEKNETGALSRGDLRGIFQTKQLKWSDGTPILALNLPAEHDARRRMDRVVLGLEPDQVEKYWIDRKIRGGERPPRRIPNEDLVMRVVQSKEGAIGYVSERELPRGVKLVAKIVGGEVVEPK